MKGLQSCTTSLSELFPIGSIYISTSTTNPSTIFGGSWEQIKDKFLLCSGSTYSNGSTGGASSHYHTTGNCTLTVNQIPSHTHTLVRQQWYSADTTVSASTGSIYSWKGGTGEGGSTSYSWRRPDGAYDLGNTGGGGAHNHGNTGSTSNIPPYIAVVVWKRVE